MQFLLLDGECSMEVLLLQNTDQDSVTEAILFYYFLFLNLYVSHNFMNMCTLPKILPFLRNSFYK